MQHRDRAPHPARPSIASTRIIVPCMTSTGFETPLFSATTSACVTTMVRPARTTRPVAINRSPTAGASRFTLNSTLSTDEPSGIIVSAAYPQALSAIAVTAAA